MSFTGGPVPFIGVQCLLLVSSVFYWGSVSFTGVQCLLLGCSVFYRGPEAEGDELGFICWCFLGSGGFCDDHLLVHGKNICFTCADSWISVQIQVYYMCLLDRVLGEHVQDAVGFIAGVPTPQREVLCVSKADAVPQGTLERIWGLFHLVTSVAMKAIFSKLGKSSRQSHVKGNDGLAQTCSVR